MGHLSVVDVEPKSDTDKEIIMFLNMLTTEEKYHYLNLAEIAANINGTVEDEEREFIDGYKREMNISSDVIPEGIGTDEESIFRFFSASELSHKRIVLFEMIGLLTCDRELDDEESHFIFRLFNGIGLSADEVDTISELSVCYYDIITEIAKTLFA